MHVPAPEIMRTQHSCPASYDLSSAYPSNLILMTSRRAALRLYSPVTSHSRKAKVDTTLPRGGGRDGQIPVIVRAGTTVVWSTYSLNRDPRWYGDDWAEYRPERWASLGWPRAAHPTAATAGEGGTGTDIGGGGETVRDFFMPFGSGPRLCLGQQTAQTEVSYVVVRLLQEFPYLMGTREETEHTAFREAKAVSFCSADGVWVSVDRDWHRELEQGS